MSFTIDSKVKLCQVNPFWCLFLPMAQNLSSTGVLFDFCAPLNLFTSCDDPISSLDSNHLFNTYALIKDIFFDNNDKNQPCKALQFFISTHNFEFFNLLKDWIGGDRIKPANRSFYIIERIKSGNGVQSNIKELPKVLSKHKSEYAYLFSIIWAFKSGGNSDFDYIYNLPNIIRRFIESFTAFKYLGSRNIEENINKLISDPTKCERVRKFVHYHSHSLNAEMLIRFFDPTECLDVIEILFDSIKLVDEAHYDALMQQVKPQNNPAGVAI
jgi:wobble nucleotide-excising tRNase